MEKFGRFALVFSLAAFVSAPAGAAGYKAKDGTFVVNAGSDWREKESINPAVVLRLEKGEDFVEFSKLDSKLSDYYLKSRVREQIESLRSKGSSLSSDISRFSIRAVSKMYYTCYETMGSPMCVGFLTYGDNSFALSSKGLSASRLKGVVSTFRRPGEKLVFPKPKPKPKPRAKRKPEKSQEKKIDEVVFGLTKDVEKEGKKNAKRAAGEKKDESRAGAGEKKKPEKPAAQETAGKEKKEKKEKEKPAEPMLKRKPLPFTLWIALFGMYLLFFPVAKRKAASVQDPKIPPPPKDIPPDFFFPFLITRFNTLDAVLYNITTRQRQKLEGYYFNAHEFYFAAAAYLLFFLHVFWSFSVLISPDFFVRSLLGIPFGAFFSSFPEVVALPFIFKALSLKSRASGAVEVQDALRNPIVKVSKDPEHYALVRDSKGKEVGTLRKYEKDGKKIWDFVDTDDQIVFSVLSEHPEIATFGKLLGSRGGLFRPKYFIYAPEERLAGFLLNDPTSMDRFQIHLDYAFSRLSHPSHILGTILCILSRERDRPYPTIFF